MSLTTHMLSDMVALVAILQKSCFVLKVLVRRFNKTLQYVCVCVHIEVRLKYALLLYIDTQHLRVP